MGGQSPALKNISTSYEEPNPLGRVIVVLDHLGVEMTIEVPAAATPGSPNFYAQAEQFFRDAADLCAQAKAEFKRISESD